VADPQRCADELEGLDPPARDLVREELEILARVKARVAQSASAVTARVENLDQQLIELRDAVAEAKEEDVASLIDQMHQVAALSQSRGKGRTLPVDPESPYFGHLRLREGRSGKQRDVLIGRRTLLDDAAGLSIVDWRNAPVSRLYYRYDEGDDYEEEFDDRSLEGTVLVRRSLGIANGQLRRINTPDATYRSDAMGVWHGVDGAARPALEGGVGWAARVPRGRLGIHEDDEGLRSDKHLQEITALIDPEQFALITGPDSGVVLIQGGAGSGKTTVALHRVAYLAFADPDRFVPAKMMIVVFNEALVEYIRHVLPSLGVEGVTVTTYRRWTASLLRRLALPVDPRRSQETPEAVVRFKKHKVVLAMIEEKVAADLQDLRERLVARIGDPAGSEQVLARLDELSAVPTAQRAARLAQWLAKDRVLAPRVRAAAQSVLGTEGEDFDVLDDWQDIFGDPRGIEDAIARIAPDDFSPGDVRTIVRWCSQRVAAIAESLDERRHRRVSEEDDSEPVEFVEAEEGPPELDAEDDAILLRLIQVRRGGLFVGDRRLAYEHLVIDEAQDLCPLEVRVLLDATTPGRSVTIAGDRAQKMVFDNGFSDWPQLLGDAGLPHVEIQPLKITYRSTRQVMQLARAVLGDLHDPSEQLVARDGAAVSYYGFSEMGEAVGFLAESLRTLMAREPSASVAVITRFPQQASAWHEALQRAEVPRLRVVLRQDFSFTAGIDVTDVRQVKGLEFDYVVIVDPTAQNYPARDASRHLLHIAMTRTAYQLWLVCAGDPTPLLPSVLVETGELIG
jgi:DNA helicase-2/ATP-dependent DNA helicase PcrA